MLMQFVILHFFLDYAILISIADAGVYAVLTFLFGIGIWYMIAYLTINEQKYYKILADHLVTGGVVVLLWLYLGYLLLSFLLKENTEYLLFLKASMPWRFIYFILIYTLLVLIYYLMNYYQNFQDKLIDEAALKQSIQESELNLLKSQINPHFLFNSLNSINSLIMTDADKASEMVLELSDFLRYTVRKDENEQVSLKKELENTRRYLGIEKIRFGNRLLVEEDVPPTCLDCIIPNMILQPIYENAVKHGVNESTGKVTITTKCRLENGEVKISISNNYSAGSLSRKGKGIGIENIRKRLLLMFRRSDLLRIEKDSRIFTVHLILPVTTSYSTEDKNHGKK